MAFINIFASRAAHRQPKPPRNKARQTRLGIEALEDRTVPAGLFSDLASAMTDQIQGRFAALRDVLDSNAALHRLPVVGTPLTQAATFIDQAREQLHQAFAGLDALEDVGEEDVKEAIVDVLGPTGIGILGDRSSADGEPDQVIDTHDVEVTLDLDAEQPSIEITFDLHKSQSLDTQFDLGLPSLPFQLQNLVNSLQATYGFDYHNLSFGIANGASYLDLNTGSGSDLVFTASAGLDDAWSREGAIGFIHGEISSTGTGVTAEIGIDFADAAAPVFDVSCEPQINLHLSGEPLGPNFPGVSADLHVSWPDGFGQSPLVEIRNIQVEFSSRFLAPIVEHLEPILNGAGKVVDVLDKPIPVLSDLGLGDVSVLSIVKLLDQIVDLPPSYEAIAKGVITVTDIVDILGSLAAGDEDRSFTLDLGDYRVDGDVYGQNALSITEDSTSPLSNLSVGVNGLGGFNLDSVQDQINASEYLPDSLKTSLSALIDKLKNGVQWSFPLLQNPAQAIFPLFLGQETDLFKLEAHFRPENTDYDQSFGSPLGFDIGFSGQVNPELDLTFGYDSFGLRTYLRDLYNGAPTSPDKLLDGFYFGDDTAFKLTATLEAGVGLNAVVFHADAKGGVAGTLSIEVPVPDEDGRIRLRSELDDRLFVVSGSVSAYLSASVGVGIEFPVNNFLGIEKEWKLASKDLVKFNFDRIKNPWFQDVVEEPQLAKLLNDGTLRLNIGAFGNIRNYKPASVNESYYIYSTAPGEVEIYFDGQTEVFTGVTSIIGDADGGDDLISIELDPASTIEVNLSGGSGNDTLAVEGGSIVELSGDDGADQLTVNGAAQAFVYGGSAEDTLQVSGADDALLEGGMGNDNLTYEGPGQATLQGGGGNDTLLGGSGTNWLYGGTGGDTLLGGAGTNYLYGEEGNDTLTGGTGHNELYGGLHNDQLTAGPLGDLLFGGSGNDVFLAGAGDDQIHVAETSDIHSVEMISWEAGDGNTTIHAINSLTVALEMLGSSSDDSFEVRDSVVGQVRIHAPGNKTIQGSGLDDIHIDALQGRDHIVVRGLLPGQDVDRIGVNLSDNLAHDGQVDRIEVFGSANADNLVVDQVQVILADYDPALFHAHPESALWGGVMSISGMPSYTVYAMNLADDLRVQTLGGNDAVQVNSVTGPTLINTGSGNDSIHVSAATSGEPGIDGNGPVPPDYAAIVDVEAGSGSNLLVVDEMLNDTGDTFIVTQNRISSQLLPGVDYRATGGQFSGVTVVGTPYDDLFEIHSTTSTTAMTTVYGWNGNDRYEAGGVTGSLASLKSPLTVTAGASGASVASFDDRAATKGNADVVLANNTITGLAGSTDTMPIHLASAGGSLKIEIDGADSAALAERFTIDGFQYPVQIRGGQGHERFEVRSLQQQAALEGSDGNENYVVKNLSQVAATLSIADLLGINDLQIDDTAAVAGRIYEMTSQSLNVTGNNFDEIVFADLAGAFSMQAGNFNDQFRAMSAPKNLLPQVNLRAGANVLAGPNVNATWTVNALNDVSINGLGRYVNATSLQGGAAADRMVFLPTGQLTGSVTGGGGVDTLDYASWNTSVLANLVPGTASGVTGSVSQVENVTGGSGNDVLLGNAGSNQLSGGLGHDLILGRAGNDVLLGGLGRDVLVGGLGVDNVQGGADDDILIGGTTIHDNNMLALQDILATWTNEVKTYQSRVTELRAGLLGPGSVLNELQADTLFGQAGLDWFWLNTNDTTDRLATELVR